MRYYIIAGEASGDLHGSNLMRHLKQADTQARFRFWGGNLMEKQGGTLVKHYRDHAYMGIFVVLKNLKTIKKNFTFCKQDILDFQTDVLILIDYSGFNLRVAKMVKDARPEITIFYYVSPQVWAWRQGRVHKIKALIDKMFVILPFEKEFYAGFDYQVEFVGHPLLDAIAQKKPQLPDFKTFCQKNHLPEKPIIAVLPGSRKQEISAMLPLMLSVAQFYPDFQFVIAGAPSFDAEYYRNFMPDSTTPVLFDQTYSILQNARAALVTSGTATLETALFNVPEVVCYKAGTLSYFIVKNLVKINYISVVNLIMDKEVIKELIQFDFTHQNLKKELDKLLFDEKHKQTMLENFSLLRKKLGGQGASQRAAQKMLEFLSAKQ